MECERCAEQECAENTPDGVGNPHDPPHRQAGALDLPEWAEGRILVQGAGGAVAWVGVVDLTYLQGTAARYPD